MKFEKTRTSYAIEIDNDKFLDLLDSESHVTENAAFDFGKQTLCQRLDEETAAEDIEYNGHFGAAVYVTLEVEDDTEENHATILAIIEEHLEWCATLEKRASTVARRKKGA